ncbi:phosphate starvation protein PhoH [Porphyromonadaceae bacterium COT-184 OH4590]|nr:phosphate starvation protein PhoH [Porphyromonadaceae bacterium COT-184 OH4590]MDO4726567.1 PhoH family protein [Porphyromonadaceae bacterium]
MQEKIIELNENVDLVVFYGVNNANMRLLKNLFPKLKMVARNNIIKIQGMTAEIARFEQVVDKLQHYCGEHNLLNEKKILELIDGSHIDEDRADNLILYGIGGKSIVARTKNQKLLVEKFDDNDLLFAIGPAGSGKTYTAISLAVKALKNKEVRRIILSRPAVEAGEKLGFLPGDMKEKIDPYLQPLYDALLDMLPAEKLKSHIETGIIQIAPLAFMRGRTLNDAVVILDEAQNTTTHQIKMFLTRMGLNTKMIITGDITQIDLPPQQKSGLVDALATLKDIRGIAAIEFDKNDIVRHYLVQSIVDAYERQEKKEKTH